MIICCEVHVFIMYFVSSKVLVNMDHAIYEAVIHLLVGRMLCNMIKYHKQPFVKSALI